MSIHDPTTLWRIVGWKDRYDRKAHHLRKPSIHNPFYICLISFYSGCKKWRKEFSLGTADLEKAIKRRDSIYKSCLGRTFTEKQLRTK